MLKKYPSINYGFGKNDHKELVNFCVGILVERLNISNKLLFRPYNVQETDTPEIIANEVYEDPEYWWTILLVNDIINPFSQWIRPTTILSNSIVGDDVLHFLNVDTGYICDDIDDKQFREWMATGVTLPEHINAIRKSTWESDQNNKRFKINLINPDYIEVFVDEYEHALKWKGYR